MANVVGYVFKISLLFLAFVATAACSSAIPEIEGLYPHNSKNISANALLCSDGSVYNSEWSHFKNDVSNPRTLQVLRKDREQLDGYDIYGVMTGLLAENGGMSPMNVDPRVVSAGYKPDTLQLYGLMSYGRIVEIKTNGEANFDFSCPFKAGCDGFVRYKSISPGYNDNLFLLDEAGQLFEASNLSQPLATFSPRVSQVSYF